MLNFLFCVEFLEIVRKKINKFNGEYEGNTYLVGDFFFRGFRDFFVTAVFFMGVVGFLLLKSSYIDIFILVFLYI